MGERLVVQTELVDVVNDAQLWGGQFNRKLEDIFDVQEELARQISERQKAQNRGFLWEKLGWISQDGC